MTVYKLTNTTEVSADWLLGYDVPKSRRERTGIGALEQVLPQYVNALLVQKLGGPGKISPEFVAKAHGASGADMLRMLALSYVEDVRQVRDRRLAYEERQKRRAAGIHPIVEQPPSPSFGARLRGYTSDEERAQYEAEDKKMEQLGSHRPPPRRSRVYVRRPGESPPPRARFSPTS